MDALFGISMNTIMIVLVAMLGFTMSVVLFVFLRNRIIFLMGLRNIPRRMAQTVLIIIGLMLSTLIITAAFTTGDTVDYSITKQSYDLLGHADIILDGEIGRPVEGRDDQNISASDYEKFLSAADATDFQHVDGYAGALVVPVPVVNPSTNLSEPNLVFMGIDAERVDAFPDFHAADSGEALDLGELGPGEVYLNESGADELGAEAGDLLQVWVEGQPHDFTVRAVVRDTGAAGAIDSASPEGMVAALTDVQELIADDSVTLILVSANGGVRDALPNVPAAEQEINDLIAANNLQMEVSDTKTEIIDEAEEIGNFMTTFFLLLGLFSIGAGMLLIVMIFVMLAAERKSEMGMARAVGTKRRHLVEMFLAEGSAYNLAAAVVGVFLGVLVAFALTTAASAMFSTFGWSFTPHVTLRTIVISYSLGVVITFITVTFASWRVSNLNIVRAIRDIPEPTGSRMGWKGVALWAVGMLASVYFVYSGLQSDTAFTFMLGLTIIVMGASVFATHFGVPARPAYTTMALFLLITWGMAAGGRLDSITGKLDGDFEMFFESGVAMVTASTFIIIYNADILLAVISRVGGAFGPILPAVRTAVAYPMANRFRTGMTLAMISLVVFALTTMSAMNLNYDKLFLKDESRGGWDVQVIENSHNPMQTVKSALEEAGSPAAAEIRAEGAILLAGFDSATEVTQDADAGWDDYPVRGLTDGFIENGSVPLDKIANGYEDEAAVWQALLTEPDVAIIDAFPIQGGFGPSEFSIDGIPTEGDRYDAPEIIVRDASTGQTRIVRVIGVVAFGASSNFLGIFMGEQAWGDVFGQRELAVHYVALTNPDNSGDTARAIESALVTSGAQADSLKEIAEEQNALSRNFLYLMQAFMGLGLVVGIAAIGVIAFRTVVERRQQIGMLRAIGYKKSMVSLSFIMESSFVTVLGVTSGSFLGLWLAYFLVTSDDFPGEGNTFYIPWLEMTVIALLTIFASALMTLIPARQAASVPTAEALRYE